VCVDVCAGARACMCVNHGRGLARDAICCMLLLQEMMGPYSRFVRTERDALGLHEAALKESSNEVRALRQALAGNAPAGPEASRGDS
jgi:hypothetical protein